MGFLLIDIFLAHFLLCCWISGTLCVIGYSLVHAIYFICYFYFWQILIHWFSGCKSKADLIYFLHMFTHACYVPRSTEERAQSAEERANNSEAELNVTLEKVREMAKKIAALENKGEATEGEKKPKEASQPVPPKTPTKSPSKTPTKDAHDSKDEKKRPESTASRGSKGSKGKKK